MAKGYEIRNGYLFVDGEQVPYKPSPNHGGRIVPRKIIDHDTAGPSLMAAVNWFLKRKSRVSAHVTVGMDGEIVQSVRFDRAAYHAGRSNWKGASSLNGWSIGIELVSPGRLVRVGNNVRGWWGGTYPIEDVKQVTTKSHGRGYWLPYPKKQIDVNSKIIEALCKAYPTIDEVLGHYHISPGRKIDPSPLFEFSVARAAMHGVAKQAEPNLVTDQETIAESQRILGELGYGAGSPDGFIGPRTESAIWAFQKQNGLEPTGKLTHETARFIESRDVEKVEFPNGHREMVTEKEIVQTSRIAKEAKGEKNEGVVTLLAGVGLAGMSQVKEASDALAGIVASWGWGAVIFAGGTALICLGWRRYRKGLRILWLRLTDHQTGRHIGGPVS